MRVWLGGLWLLQRGADSQSSPASPGPPSRRPASARALLGRCHSPNQWLDKNMRDIGSRSQSKWTAQMMGAQLSEPRSPSRLRRIIRSRSSGGGSGTYCMIGTEDEMDRNVGESQSLPRLSSCKTTGAAAAPPRATRSGARTPRPWWTTTRTRTRTRIRTAHTQPPRRHASTQPTRRTHRRPTN
jgi:hypothetical protein